MGQAFTERWPWTICPSRHRIFVWCVPESALMGAGIPPHVDKHWCLRSFVKPCYKQALMWKSTMSTDQEDNSSSLDGMQGQEVRGTKTTLLPRLQPMGRSQINLCVPWNNALLVTTADRANLGGKKGGLSLLPLHAYPSQRCTPKQSTEIQKGHSWVKKGLQGAKDVTRGRIITAYISNQPHTDRPPGHRSDALNSVGLWDQD